MLWWTFWQLKSKDTLTRKRAVGKLDGKKSRRLVKPLITALKDNDDYVRSRAAFGLREIKDPRAIEPLITALKDKYSGVRSAAAEALGKIKDPRAVEPLITALKDDDSRVRKAAAEAQRAIENIEELYNLYKVIQSGNTQKVGLIIRSGVSVNTLIDIRKNPYEKDMFTPLMIAANRGDAAMVEYLLSIGAKVNQPNNFGLTALLSAVHGSPDTPSNNYLRCIKILIDAGASPDAQDFLKITPLSAARQRMISSPQFRAVETILSGG